MRGTCHGAARCIRCVALWDAGCSGAAAAVARAELHEPMFREQALPPRRRQWWVGGEVWHFLV